MYPIIYHLPTIYDRGSVRPLGFTLPNQEKKKPPAKEEEAVAHHILKPSDESPCDSLAKALIESNNGQTTFTAHQVAHIILANKPSMDNFTNEVLGVAMVTDEETNVPYPVVAASIATAITERDIKRFNEFLDQVGSEEGSVGADFRALIEVLQSIYTQAIGMVNQSVPDFTKGDATSPTSPTPRESLLF